MTTRAELEAAVESGDVNRVLSLTTVEDIADAWWRATARWTPGESAGEQDMTSDPDWWALEFWVGGAPVYDDQAIVQLGLVALADRAPQGSEVSHLGAGPLENYVNDDDDRLSWLEQQAQRSVFFQKALGTIWCDDLTEASIRRLERAAGTALARAKR